MKNQQRFTFFVLFASIIQVQCFIIGCSRLVLTSTNSFDQCPQIKNDEDVVSLKNFTIPLNPHKSYHGSRGYLNENKRIYSLKIINDKLIPSEIFGLTQLTRLEIESTQFSPGNETTIPSNIRCFASLDELSISNIRITHLPDTIGELHNLTTLKLANTGLMSLPYSIGELSSLTSLSLPNNNLTSLPITIRKLVLLKTLILINNPYLRCIEAINNLPFLQILDIRRCSIETLPQNLSQLTTLYMTNNNLSKLTGIETLGNGTDSPKSLYFNKNHIQSLPPAIDQVKNLHELHLNDNQLRTLPANILNITTLKKLYVENNTLNKIELRDISHRFK